MPIYATQPNPIIFLKQIGNKFWTDTCRWPQRQFMCNLNMWVCAIHASIYLLVHIQIFLHKNSWRNLRKIYWIGNETNKQNLLRLMLDKINVPVCVVNWIMLVRFIKKVGKNKRNNRQIKFLIYIFLNLLDWHNKVSYDRKNMIFNITTLSLFSLDFQTQTILKISGHI